MIVPPFTPMSPLLTDHFPQGEGWIHQLKWDGYRTLAWVDNGQVELYSKRMLLKNSKFPDLVKALAGKSGTFLLDGEAVVLDAATQRPSFQKMQQRDKLRSATIIDRAAEKEPVQYILFDLLFHNGVDLRAQPLSARMEVLQQLTSDWAEPFFLTDSFEDSSALWDWVVSKGWEGVVSKRLDSQYKEGKHHSHWMKRKTVYQTDAEAVGILYKEGRISSFVMRKDGLYFGRVSSGLNGAIKQELARLEVDDNRLRYFELLPEGLRGTTVQWLLKPLPLVVTGLEVTEGGTLRQPQLLKIGGKLL